MLEKPVRDRVISRDEYHTLIWRSFCAACYKNGEAPTKELFRETLEQTPLLKQFMDLVNKKFDMAEQNPSQMAEKCFKFNNS